MNGPSAERRMRRVAKQVEALPMVPQNYEERYAQVEAALLAGTATDTDFRWIVECTAEGRDARSALMNEAKAILRGDAEPPRSAGWPQQQAIQIITTPLGRAVPAYARSSLLG